MNRKYNLSGRIKMTLMRAACVLMAFTVIMMTMPHDCAYAKPEKNKTSKETAKEEPEKPIREVHKVAVGDRLYCFFVTHNVVLTPAEIAEMNDEELNSEIIKRSGLYMKEANCNKASHKTVSPEAWDKDRWHIYISDADIAELRNAEPADGEPVKLHMDLRIGDKKQVIDVIDTEDEDEEITEVEEAGETDEETPEEEPEVKTEMFFSTFKPLSPRILFIAVATEEDAAYGEDICEEEKTPEKQKKKTKKTADGGGGDEGGEPEEMLPEYRTISMEDRSGAPLEETLKDGKPVTLEWVEPDRHAESGRKSFIDRIPGRGYGLAAGIAAAAALIAFAAVRKRREE